LLAANCLKPLKYKDKKKSGNPVESFRFLIANIAEMGQ
jgi:hypothetical protein